MGTVAYAIFGDTFAIRTLRQPVLLSLRDPESAQFRNERLVANRSVVCGEFNAKNGMGGYTGFSRYISNGTGHATSDGDFDTWVGKGEKSAQDILDRLKVQNAVLKAFRAANLLPTEMEIQAAYNAKLFEDRWRSLCG